MLTFLSRPMRVTGIVSDPCWTPTPAEYDVYLDGKKVRRQVAVADTDRGLIHYIVERDDDPNERYYVSGYPTMATLRGDVQLRMRADSVTHGNA